LAKGLKRLRQVVVGYCQYLESATVIVKCGFWLCQFTASLVLICKPDLGGVGILIANLTVKFAQILAQGRVDRQQR